MLRTRPGSMWTGPFPLCCQTSRKPYVTFCFGFAFLSIPLISLPMRNYLITARGVEEWPNIRPVKPNGLCHRGVCFCFLLQITSGIHGRFKARMRTKGCGTISTLSSCSIDPHMGHGPPLLSPRPSPSLYGPRTILVISFHRPGEWPELINYQLLAAWLYCRPESFLRNQCLSVNLNSSTFHSNYGR